MPGFFDRIKDQFKSTFDNVTGEILAQRHYDRARKLVGEGLDRAVAREIIAELEAFQAVDCNFKACIHRLLGQAYSTLEEPDQARQHLEEALEYLNDPEERRHHERRIIEDFDMPVEDLMSELHVELAHVRSLQGNYREAVYHAQEATKLNRANLTGYYLWGAGMLQLGIPPREAFDIFLRAVPIDKGGMIEGWIEELLPELLDEFRRVHR